MNNTEQNYDSMFLTSLGLALDKFKMTMAEVEIDDQNRTINFNTEMEPERIFEFVNYLGRLTEGGTTC